MRQWARLLVLVVTAALLASTQCYAMCLASASHAVDSASGLVPACHDSLQSRGSQSHGSPSDGKGRSQCSHQHHSPTVASEVRQDTVQAGGHVPAFATPLLTIRLYSQAGCFPVTRAGALRILPPDKPLFLALSVFRL